MLRNLFTKLIPQSQKGFSHHLLLPLVAVLAVGGIGAYLTFGSKAASYSCPSGYHISEMAPFQWQCVPNVVPSGMPPKPTCDPGYYPLAIGSEWRRVKEAAPWCPSGQHVVRIGSEWRCVTDSKGGGGGTGGGTGGGVSKSCPQPHPTVKSGASSGCIAHAQDLLTRAGFKTTVDGVWGSQTQASIKAFQAKYKLTVDGELGKTDWEYLHKARSGGNPAPAPVYKNAHDKAYGCSYPRPTVQYGSKHNCVRYLQWTLNHDLHLDLARDGDFGSATKDAILKLKAKYTDMPAGEVFSTHSWLKLDELMRAKFPRP